MFVGFVAEAIGSLSCGNPEEVLAVGGGQKQFGTRILLYKTDGVPIHRVGEAVLGFATFRNDGDGALVSHLLKPLPRLINNQTQG